MSLELYNRCHTLFLYNEGELFRRQSGGGQNKGSEAGWIDYLGKNKQPYRRVKIDGKCFLVHRIVHLMFTGKQPEVIDHINGQSLDNRIENLRPATKKTNRWNSMGNAGTQSGIKGVYLDRGRWKALVNVAGNRYYLGMYNTKEEAAEVVNAKYKELQQEYAVQHRALIANNVCNSYDYSQDVDENGLEITDEEENV
jgi:hypothetical protein